MPSRVAGSKKKTPKKKSDTAAPAAASPPAPVSGEGFVDKLKAEVSALEAKDPLALQTTERLPGDDWDGTKLLSRVIDYGRDDVDVQIPSDQWQARAAAYEEAVSALEVTFPLEASTVRKALRDKKADLVAKVLKIGAEVKTHIEKVETDIEQVADYANDVSYWRTTDTKRRVESEGHEAAPLTHEEKQSALPVGERTKMMPRKDEVDLEDMSTPIPVLVRGTQRWLDADMPGFTYLPGEAPEWRKMFGDALEHLANRKENPTDRIDDALFDKIVEAGRAKLIKKFQAEQAGKPIGVTSGDGGQHSPPGKRYKDDPANPGHCLGCKADLFSHPGISEACPETGAPTVQ